MPKVILITGATDGIGLLTAETIVKAGHHLIIHGRNTEKLNVVVSKLSSLTSHASGSVEPICADLSDFSETQRMITELSDKYTHLDVIINNAGVYKTHKPISQSGLDVRFVVNTLAPYWITQSLLTLMDSNGRVVNLASAAQAPLELDLLVGDRYSSDPFNVYAQSKLALIMWTRYMAKQLAGKGPQVMAVNPGSLLASKMVKEGFGVEGKNLAIGADILVRASLSGEFSEASGLYFDNDSGNFTSPHPYALNDEHCAALVHSMQTVLNRV